MRKYKSVKNLKKNVITIFKKIKESKKAIIGFTKE
jgi:hypothetical protein